MIRQCAVMVGGLGTRLGSLTTSTPKPILQVGGRPFLAWLLRELARFGIEDTILLTGFRTDRIRAALAEIAAFVPVRMRITISEEHSPAGTGGALWHARSLLDEKFLVCNGDSLFATNLAPLLTRGQQDAGGVLGHLLLRHVPDAARYGIVETTDDRVISFREKTGESKPAWINAGIYTFDRRILHHLTESCSLERDALGNLASAGCLRAMRGDGYFIDIGIPDDLAQSRACLSKQMLRPALILGLGCIVKSTAGPGKSPEDAAWVDGALSAVRLATERGWHVFVVSGQAGDDSEAQRDTFSRRLAHEARKAGGTIDDARLQSSGSLNPAAVADLLDAWEVDRNTAILVGTNSSEIQAGEAIGATTRLFPGGDLLAFLTPVMAAKR